MSKYTVEQVVEELEAAGANVYERYSGRMMFGDECVGFECESDNESFRIFVDIAEHDIAMAHELARQAKTDSMGRGMIVYFPWIKYAKKAA